MKHIILFDNDIQRYPPILSVINILLELNKEVTFYGDSESKLLLKQLKDKGVDHVPVNIGKLDDNKISKFFAILTYREKIKRLVKNENKSEIVIWLFGNTNLWVLNKLVLKYKTIVYFFEVPKLKIAPRYKLISPFLNYKKTIQKAWKVISVEYNRAHIIKALFSLEETPVVIPNKPHFDLSTNKELELDQLILSKLNDKKIILYQGIFNYPERRLDELCQAIDHLSEDYILCIMGPDDYNKSRLKKDYPSDKIIFLPFITPPLHLEITKKAYIGFLSYFPSDNRISSILNVLYCAPNKIYEYSAFGIPMVSNDVPALEKEFKEFNAGIADKFFTPKSIVNTINEISLNYEEYSKGAYNLYNSVNIKEMISSTIN